MNDVKWWQSAAMAFGGMVLALGGCNQFLSGAHVSLWLSAAVFVTGVVIALVGLTLFVFHR